MSSYNINFKRLALLLLPTFLRRPVMVSLLYAAMVPLGHLHAKLMQFSREMGYRLNYNGQTCYLRAVLNDTFDPELRRIYITDNTVGMEPLTVHKREVKLEVLLPARGYGHTLMVNRRGFGGISGYDFIVHVPSALGVDEARLSAVVSIYKLVSKRFAISYF